MNPFFEQLKRFAATNCAVAPPAEVMRSAAKLVLFFTLFYFAIFKFTQPRERLIQGLLEYLFMGTSLFAAFVIYGISIYGYLKLTGKKLFLRFASTPFEFIVIYTLAIGFLFLMKQSYYQFEKSWVIRYYWRHFPYAFVIFGVYTYRVYKNSIIENLVNRVNADLESRSPRQGSSSLENPQSIVEIQVDSITRRIDPRNISHISVNGHYLDIFHHFDDQHETLLVRKPLKEILEELPNQHFIQIHRSHIVNLYHVLKLKKRGRQYSLLLQHGEYMLPISRNNLKDVLSRIEMKL